MSYDSQYKVDGNWSYRCLSLCNGALDEIFIHLRISIIGEKVEPLRVCDGECRISRPDNEKQMFPVSERVAKAIDAAPGFNALVRLAYSQYRNRRSA